MRHLYSFASAAVIAACLHSAAAAADAAESSSVEELIVTGTRTTGLKAIDSPAPVQVLGESALQRVGQPDLIQALAQNVPSFNAQAFGGDTANLTLSAKLRGLSPNHALVLVNGKRRHTTANLAVLGGPFQGGASTDLNFIPVASIERIEVLQDGAAAQYGTDAIAGVINIILKKNAEGGTLTASGGAYYEGDGETADLTGNIGFGFGDGKGYLSLTGETKYHGFSDRSGIDPRVIDPANLAANPNLRLFPGYPYVNHISGDARYTLNVVSFNSGYEFESGITAYAFGSYGTKYSAAYENYRLPNRIPGLWPLGFNPKESIKETDFEIAGGVTGEAAGWTWDLSTSYGRDDNDVNVTNSGNASLFADTGASPTKFHAGDFIATRRTSNLDISREFDAGMPEPLNLAFGVEQRHEKYEIKAGDAASRYKEGSQSYPGFSLTDAGKHSRDNIAVYVDVALSPVEKLLLDLAARFEHFSDFGDTTVAKITGRYDFSEAFALRGTASTGFRAPTLAESYYSATNVSPTSAFVQLPPNSAGAKLVGIDGLDAEESKNYSVGFVAHPGGGLTITLDAYQIEIDDRIAGSGALYAQGGAVNSPAVQAAILANGNVLDPTVTFVGIQIFANGLDTRTRGAELLMTWTTDLAEMGAIDWSLTGNYNKTKVTSIKASPAQLGAQSLYDATAISNLETASPKYRLTAGALWTMDKWTVNLREALYGPSSDMQSPDGGTYYENKVGTKLLTDLEVSYKITDALKVTGGANNLFDKRPEQINQALLAIYRANLDNTGVGIYPSFSPIGINGGYYYVKVSYTL